MPMNEYWLLLLFEQDRVRMYSLWLIVCALRIIESIVGFRYFSFEF